MSAVGFWAWWGWGPCPFVARLADSVRCVERVFHQIEAWLDEILIWPAPWWIGGWGRAPERWWS